MGFVRGNRIILFLYSFSFVLCSGSLGIRVMPSWAPFWFTKQNGLVDLDLSLISSGSSRCGFRKGSHNRKICYGRPRRYKNKG